MKLLHSLLILSFSVSVVLTVEGVTDKPSEPPKPEDPPSPPKIQLELDPLAETVDPKEFPPSPKTPYVVKSSDDKITCLEATFAVQFTVEVTDGKEKKTQYLSVRDANVTNPNGCPEDLKNATELELQLNFEETSQVTFFFKRENPGSEKESQYLEKIKIVFIDLFGIKQTSTLDTPAFVTNGTHKSYECKAETKLDKSDVKATFKAVHIDAFRDAVETKNTLTTCPADDDVNDMIPIAVGAALLALVAIVLVAYFIGRRRSRRLAYQSV